MGEEKEDPDDVIYEENCIKVYTQKYQYNMMKEAYQKELFKTVENFNDYINSKAISIENLEFYKNKIYAYVSMISLIDLAIEQDSSSIRRTIIKSCNDLYSDDYCNYQYVGNRLNKKVKKTKRQRNPL